MPKILLASSQYRFIGSKKLGTLGDAYHMIEMVRLRMYNLIAPRPPPMYSRRLEELHHSSKYSFLHQQERIAHLKIKINPVTNLIKRRIKRVFLLYVQIIMCVIMRCMS